ncbi:MAG: hypothetical protein ABEJ79_11425 [Halolamina sp.]
MTDADPRRTVAVDPPVHVEAFATHHTLTWQAAGLSTFLDALGAVDRVPDEPALLVETTDTAGRRRLTPADVADDGAVTYVRVESVSAWTLSWERRTLPTVSLSGEPTATTCRAVHVATTDCDGWTDERRRELARRLDSA